VYTLQQLQHHTGGVQLQHSAPLCYFQGSFVQQGSMPQQAGMMPTFTRHRSPQDNTSAAEQGSEEREQEPQMMDGTQ
jgi:hypothetical protein